MGKLRASKIFLLDGRKVSEAIPGDITKSWRFFFSEVTKTCCETANKAINIINTRAIQFVKEGNISKTARENMRKPSLLEGCTDWQVATDLKHNFIFLTVIALTTKRLDIVIWSVKAKKVFVIELTVLFEENFDWAHQRKLTKYEDLREQCVRNGLITNVFPIQVGCRGFIDNLTSVFLTNLGLPPSDKRIYMENIQDKALTASALIWQSHRATTEGARGAMVIVVRNEHGDSSSNPERE